MNQLEYHLFPEKGGVWIIRNSMITLSDNTKLLVSLHLGKPHTAYRYRHDKHGKRPRRTEHEAGIRMANHPFEEFA